MEFDGSRAAGGGPELPAGIAEPFVPEGVSARSPTMRSEPASGHRPGATRAPSAPIAAAGALFLALAFSLGGLAESQEATGGDPLPRASGSDPPGRAREISQDHLERYREMTEAAIERGLRYLSERQDGAGHFSTSYPVAVTALGGMAMLGDGVTYGRGRYGYDVRQAVEYLTDSKVRDDSGFICERSGDSLSKMHGHTYAILFLSQVVGSLPDPAEDAKVRRVVEQGVALIIRSQTVRGGWGYLPGDEQDEASLTVCALQALRAAKDAGIHVPPETIRSAVRYLKECCKEDGSFRYSLTRGSRESTYELTAAAVSTLDAAGEYGMEEHARGVSFLRKTIDEAIAARRSVIQAASGYPFYGNLYAGQVYHQLGGEIWELWSSEAWPELMRMQKADGHWESRFGNEYATAMALLILEIPRGYLPIFER